MGVTRLRDDQMQGEIQGPASATDNAIVRFDGTTGKVAQDSSVTINDSGDLNITTGDLVVTNGVYGAFIGVDNYINADTIHENTIDSGVTTDGVLLKDKGATLQDSTTYIVDDGDATKKAQFQASGITTGTTRTYTFPDASGTLTLNDATQTLTNKDLSSGNTFPTFNQNTTGSAAKWTTARNLAGNSVDGSANVAFANKFIVQGTSDSGLSAAQFLGSLSTGIVKVTTTTGVLSTAVAGDFPTLNQNTTGSAATLTTSRTFRTDLASTSTASFDGSANVTPGVTGVLGSSNGGAGTVSGIMKANGSGTVSAATAGTDYTSPSSTETMTNKTLTTPTIAQINNSTAPGVKLQLRTQTDNSNSISNTTTAGVYIQMGWGQAPGDGSATITDTLTFPTAFTTVLGVLVGGLSKSSGGSTAATDITNITGFDAKIESVNASSITTTGCSIEMQKLNGGTFGSGNYYGYSWIAWGT